MNDSMLKICDLSSLMKILLIKFTPLYFCSSWCFCGFCLGYRVSSKGSFEEKPINEAKGKEMEVKDVVKEVVDEDVSEKTGVADAGIELTTFGV